MSAKAGIRGIRYEMLTQQQELKLLEKAYFSEAGELVFIPKPGVLGSEGLKFREHHPDGRVVEDEIWVDLYEDFCNSLGMVFKRIPGGSFVMGSPEDEEGRFEYEGPQHRVHVPTFELQETTVTRSQWLKVMGSDPSHFKDGDMECPVHNVLWKDCQRFIARINEREGTAAYRLPSEAEWEYACRAGTTGPFNFDLPITTDKANCDGNGSYAGSPKGVYRSQPVPVKSFEPNAWGLYEMHGNVWEWCQDWWHNSYEGAPTDGSAWESGGEQKARVVRGGSWYSHPPWLRSAFRLGDTPVNRNGDDIGFRLARTLVPPGILTSALSHSAAP